MKAKTVNKIIDLFEKEIDKMSDQQIMSIEYQFSRIKDIANKFERENVMCYTTLYYINGYSTSGICLLTDGLPGSIFFQTRPDSDIAVPHIQIIPPEEWEEWMDSYCHLFSPDLPLLDED